MNLLWDRLQIQTNNALSRLQLGTVTAQGYLRDQLQRSKAGMGGHLDELEEMMIGEPFTNRARQLQIRPKVSAGWCAEISGTYWTGLVQLAFTLGDGELIAKATRWVDGVIANMEEDGYLGAYTHEDNRLEDYNAWGSNWAMRAMLSFYEATGRQDVLSAVHRGL